MAVIVVNLNVIELALQLESSLYPAETPERLTYNFPVHLQDQGDTDGGQAVEDIMDSGRRKGERADIIPFVYRVKADRHEPLPYVPGVEQCLVGETVSDISSVNR